MDHYLITLLSIGGIYLLLAQALNFQYGFAGLANFGVVGFYAIGAYTSALLSMAGWPVPVSVLVGGLAGVLASLLLGRICLRLRADYLGIVTLSFSEIVRTFLIGHESLTNGPRGIANVPALPLPWSSAANFLTVIILANLLVAVGIYLWVRSPFGRSVQAMRDDEAAFSAIAKSALSYKMRVLGLGGGIMAIAGALYAHYIGYISPDQFIPLTTFYVWIAVIVGGAGRLSGALAGTLLLTLFLEGSRFLRDVLPWISEVEMASIRLAAIGLALMIMTVWRPQGLMGNYTSK
ncbi:branched-chain amino acid ABC transporter permease [Bosea massiliensis]|uniref:Branched-chain amino acid ABC transporter permease n=1 Tax=Bosea massiliensis TaxID=151419 RepID=A0ABW0P7M6_9HYPH